VQYARLQDAIKLIQEVGQGAYLSKADIKSAFRLVPIHPDYYHLFGFCWRSKYYYDTCLAMGLAEACRIFETISDSICYILKTQFGIERVVKILDDFLFVDPSPLINSFSLKAFITLTTECGIPVAWDKTSKEPSTALVFYGAHLDTTAMQVALPADKLVTYRDMVQDTLLRGKITVKELQSLIGKLQFATCAISGGRLYLRQLYDLLSPLPLSPKPYWHVRITNPARKDLEMWLSFLTHFNGISIIRQPSVVESNSLNLFTDASDFGYGACYGSRWVAGQWPSHWISYPITVRELYPIMAIINTFGYKLRNSRVLFHCDNQAIVAVINKQSSKDKKIMALLRPLVLALLNNQINFRASYISTHANIIADGLSRSQVKPDFLKEHSLQSLPDHIPEDLRPESLTL